MVIVGHQHYNFNITIIPLNRRFPPKRGKGGLVGDMHKSPLNFLIQVFYGGKAGLCLHNNSVDKKREQHDCKNYGHLAMYIFTFVELVKDVIHFFRIKWCIRRKLPIVMDY